MSLSAFQPDPNSQLLCDLLRLDRTYLSDIGDRLKLVDWLAFARLATQFQLVGATYDGLRGLAMQGLVPQAALEALREPYLTQAAEDLRRKHWLGEALRELRSRKIPVIVLKGAYLAEAVYMSRVGRPMSDMDLLVHREDLEAAAQALTDLGYRPEREYFLDFELQVGHQLPPFFREGATPIELHWQLVEPEDPCKIEVSGLWDRACPAKVAGEPALGLCPEDLLLYLCLHASKHGLRPGLRTIYDVAVTMGHFATKLDWEVLERRAQGWHTERPAFLLLWLATELFGAPVPEEILRVLRPVDFRSEQADLARRLVFALPDAGVPQHLAELVQTRSFMQRLRLAWGQLFLPRENMARAYPARPDSWKIYLYYLVRWWGLFVRFWRYAGSLLRRETQVLEQSAAVHTRQLDEEQLQKWIEVKLD